jgi:MoxR-like ATPase
MTTMMPLSQAPNVDDLRRLRETLTTGLIERERAVKLALLATLAGEHLLLIGPPGTAKSMVAQRVRQACSGAYFERLLTRFTVPEELFGPLSIQGLEQDRYERLTQGYLPMATVAFLDEIFKANSAILNALLTLLNEREFDNGTRREKAPLLAIVGASNELPQGEELAALYDRFLLRLHVEPVSKQGFVGLLGAGDAAVQVPDALRLSPEKIAAVQSAAGKVTLSEDVMQLLADLRVWCQEQQIPVSDRRWRKIAKLLRTSAASNERGEVTVWDCWLLQFCCGDTKEQGGKVYEWYAARVGARKAMDPTRLTRLVSVWESNLARDMSRQVQMVNDAGQLLFVGADGKATTQEKGAMPAFRDGQRLFVAGNDWYDHNGYRVDRTNQGRGYTEDDIRRIVRRFSTLPNAAADYFDNPANLLMKHDHLRPLVGPMPVKETHKAQCLNDLETAKANVGFYLAELDAHQTSLSQTVQRHLWLDAEFASPASATLAQTRQVVADLQTRLQAVHAGYTALPVERTLIEPMDAGE